MLKDWAAVHARHTPERTCADGWAESRSGSRFSGAHTSSVMPGTGCGSSGVVVKKLYVTTDHLVLSWRRL